MPASGTTIPQPIMIADALKIEENNEVGKDLVALERVPGPANGPWHRHASRCMLAAVS